MNNFTCIVVLREDGTVAIHATQTMTEWMTRHKYKVKGVVIRHNDV